MSAERTTSHKGHVGLPSVIISRIFQRVPLGRGPVVLLFLFQTLAFADVVENKSGQLLEGTITREKDGDVTLNVDGMELTLTRDEIRSIKRGPIPKKKSVPSKALEAKVESAATSVESEASAPAAKGTPAQGSIDLNALERPVIVFDQRDWKRVSQDVRNNVVLAQFLPDGQTLQNWNELMTAQLYIGLRSEPRYYVQYVKEKTASTCPGTQWQTLRETPYDVMYEWNVKGCGSVPDQSRIARVVLGLDGLHVLEYAMKIGDMPEDNRVKWIGCLEASQIVKPQAKP